MKARLTILALTLMVLVACVSYGHWGTYESWMSYCPNFPSPEEVEKVLEEHNDLIERLVQEKLIWFAHVQVCPQGAFITLYHKAFPQIAPTIEILDEAGARTEGLNRFFGIPFRFARI